MARSEQYIQGQRAAIKWAIAWLHDRAKSMNDPHAVVVLNSAAFDLGCQKRDGAVLAAQQDGTETSAHIGWLKQYAEMMDETNWKDMRALIQRQLSYLSASEQGSPG